MPKIVIVYHSGYGHTKKAAEAVLARGSRRHLNHSGSPFQIGLGTPLVSSSRLSICGSSRTG